MHLCYLLWGMLHFSPALQELPGPISQLPCFLQVIPQFMIQVGTAVHIAASGYHPDWSQTRSSCAQTCTVAAPRSD